MNNGWMDGQMDELMDRQTDGQMDKLKNDWMDGCLPDSMLSILHTFSCFIHIEIP